MLASLLIVAHSFQVNFNYGIDWEGPISTDQETVAVDNIECPIPEHYLTQLEQQFSNEYILSSEHYAVDRYEELLSNVNVIIST